MKTIKSIISWFRISITWQFSGKKYAKTQLRGLKTKHKVIKFKRNIWNAKCSHYPNHWASKQFASMCDQRLSECRGYYE